MEDEFDIGIDTLDMTTEVINFDEIDEDLERFQEDEMVQQALHRGVDLKKYGRELERELKEAEAASISQYMDNKQQVLDLHSQIHDCDDVLLRMQEMLVGFQGDLSGISEEIRHLQEESFSMNIRLKNRRIAEELLHHFLENASISPDAMTTIADNTIDEEFLEAVVDLSNKFNYIQLSTPAKDGSSLEIAPVDTKTSIVLLPELEKLKTLAISKIRDYFTTQFMALRKPKTNVQILQQSSLIKYAPLYRFLQQDAEAAADDLRIVYIESMGKTVFHLFKNYYAQLLKLDASSATKSDTIALEETTLKTMFTTTVSKGAGNPSKRSDIFTLGERVQVIELAESAPAILVHVANAEAQSFPCEVIWRSVLKHLIDAVTNEFLFIVDFFKSAVVDTFHAIFGKTVNHLVQAMESYVGGCYDMLGLLLTIKVAHAQRLVMQRRRIPVLDAFFDRISMLLWPKFKSVFDMNIKAFKEVSVKKLGSVADLAPHYISK
jgi:vacuolar protein sorting-associated protein 52